jgi:hypothetical protein
VQQAYQTIFGLDAAANSDTARGANTTAMLKLFSAGVTPTVDVEIALVSMSTGGTSNVVYNVVNAHASAIRVFMLILGGSDITDAMVSTYTCTTSAALDDVTVTAGFGKPELVFFSSASGNSDSGSDGQTHFGMARQGVAGQGFTFAQDNGNAASVTAMSQRSDKSVLLATQAGALDYIGGLDTTVSNWPTDGFRVVYDATPGFAEPINYLAIRGTFQSASGANTALTAGSTQDNACGFVPKVGLLFGWNLAANSAVQTAAADQCGFGIGAYDGTQEAWCGFTEDDAALTMFSDSQNSTAKTIRNYAAFAAGGPTLQSEADASFSGNNFTLTWNDLDTVARQYQWLALGDAPSAAEIIPDLVMARS